MVTMTIIRTTPTGSKRQTGSGFVMYGRLETGKWYERWFTSEEKANAAANKKGWGIK